MNFSRRHSARTSPDATIDITSLIDAAFILIIFLLISTTFKKKEHAFSIALPTAAFEEVIVEIERTSLYITNDGAMYFLQLDAQAESPSPDTARQQGEKVSKDRLLVLLKAMVEKDPAVNISILAQQNTDYQKVMSALSILREAGVQGVQLPYEYAPGTQ